MGIATAEENLYHKFRAKKGLLEVGEQMKLATLCYLRADGNTLMLYRNKKKDDVHLGKWNGLGGKFHDGETPEACAKREILEECGLVAISLDLKGIITFPCFAKGEDWYVFVFVVTEFHGSLIESVEGDLKWIPDREILNLPLWEGDKHFIPWLSKPGFFSARFNYEQGRLASHDVFFYPNTHQSSRR